MTSKATRIVVDAETEKRRSEATLAFQRRIAEAVIAERKLGITPEEWFVRNEELARRRHPKA